MSTNEDDKKSTLRACLQESSNERMKNYVKILDEPGITTFEWIHRTQEELMDGIVYLEKLKDLLSMNMRELDAARMESIKRNEKKKDNENEVLPLSEVVEETELVEEKKEEPELEVKKKRKIKRKKVVETDGGN
tara:strand:- start:348 stop:749 length:402 start_codon:yes stop_codon:yes gene_type:complete